MQDLKTSLTPGNEDQDHFESLPPSPAASEKELAKNEEFERTLGTVNVFLVGHLKLPNPLNWIWNVQLFPAKS